jgi:hypothetical protein
MLDFPQPFGPTTAQRLLGNETVVGSTKDLNPASLMHFRRMKISSVLALWPPVYNYMAILSAAFFHNFLIHKSNSDFTRLGGGHKQWKR